MLGPGTVEGTVRGQALSRSVCMAVMRDNGAAGGKIMIWEDERNFFFGGRLFFFRREICVGHR